MRTLNYERCKEIVHKTEVLYQWIKKSCRTGKTVWRFSKTKFSCKKIILYGSYAKGSAEKDSDIDVAVVLSSVDEDFLISESKLFRLRRNYRCKDRACFVGRK